MIKTGGIIMKIVIARYCVEEGKRAEYLEKVGAEGIAEKCCVENGNISYEFLCPVANPNEVMVLERWESGEALDAHMKQPHFAKLQEIKKEYGATGSAPLVYDVEA
jgi:quinol monooxygenase YgiN